jgi:large subunit ribosomal protein L23
MPKEIHTYEVLRRPVVTEKSTALSAQRKYVFEVALGANKPQIKEAVEQAFDVTVEAVNTTIVRGARKKNRFGRPSSAEPPRWKKAIVTLAPGSTIEFFEGV